MGLHANQCKRLHLATVGLLLLGVATSLNTVCATTNAAEPTISAIENAAKKAQAVADLEAALATNITTVQQGYLKDYSTNRTVGKVLADFSDCAPNSQKWEAFEDQNNGITVQFSCKLVDTESYLEHAHMKKAYYLLLNQLAKSNYALPHQRNRTYTQDEINEMFELVQTTMIAQFAIDKDDGSVFNHTYLGLELHFSDGKVGDVNLFLDDLVDAYRDEPLITVDLNHEDRTADLLLEVVTAHESEITKERDRNHEHK